jgi:hypothetical protein
VNVWATFTLKDRDPLDVQSSSTGDDFLMLTPEQASFLVLYAKHPDKPFVPSLKLILNAFVQANQGRKCIDAWLVALYLCDKLNKTIEDLQEEKQKTSRKQIEKSIEIGFSDKLRQQGVAVRQQVRCPGGIADIVTPDAIYEVKAELTYQGMRHAIAQVLAYRVYINPRAKVYVVGCQPKAGAVASHLAQSLGVGVIIWDTSTGAVLEELLPFNSRNESVD